MSKTPKLPAKLILLFLVIGLMSHRTTDISLNNSELKNTIVLLKFKAQTDKGSKSVSELIKLFDKVRQEPHFVSIKLHVDPKDDTNILLYEEWEDSAYYSSEHMNTAHMQEFMVNSKGFLSGPPEISFWNMEGVFKK